MILAPLPSSQSNRPVIVDSHLSVAAALGHNHFPSKILPEMALVTIQYNGFDGKVHEGQLVVNKMVAAEVKAIFEEIRTTGFPISKCVPISRYGWDDDRSIADNNTSAFNYRFALVPGQKPVRLSRHAYGMAIDINPKINPFVGANGFRANQYHPGRPGTLSSNSVVTKIFLRHHWKWGGRWHNGHDYQHFEKASR